MNTVTAGKWIRSDKQLARERLIRKRNRRRAALASASTVVVLGVAVAAAVSSPGWERVQETFFSWSDAKASFPEIARSFWLNVKLFMVAEPIILAVGLAVAIVRGTRSAYLFPLRALAVTRIHRSSLFPELPTMDEAGVEGFDMDSWAGIVAPAHTPPEIVTKLNNALRPIIDSPAIRMTLARVGFEAFSSSPKELDDFVKVPLLKWEKMIKDANIQPE